MDPVTHTLVGATLARSGLRKRTALGTATLLIAVNAPDIDAIAYLWGNTTAVGLRRGVTHGVVALIVLPLVLTGLMVLWDRLARGPAERKTNPLVAGQVLFLAALAVATHPLLDFFNSYGMRFFAPLSFEWFYGDTLFIIDPWVWAALISGLWMARGSERAPKLALTGVVFYALVMAGSNVAARSIVASQVERSGNAVMRLMAAPVAATPFSRWVVVEDEVGYQVGLFSWLPRPRLELSRLPYDHEPPASFGADLAGDPEVRRFLSWARFPYYAVWKQGDSHVIAIGDARYTVDPEESWASLRVTIPSVGRRSADEPPIR